VPSDPASAPSHASASLSESGSVTGLIQPTLPKPRFARLRSSFRRLSTKSTPKASTSEQPLLSDISPQGSPTSSPTSTFNASIKVEEDTATLLLSLLAPLVATLQRLGGVIRDAQGGADDTALKTFTRCCEDLKVKVEGYKHSKVDDRIDPHDLEMKTLLLDALLKKIENERTSIEASTITHLLPPVISQSRRASIESDSSITLSTRRESDENPLILHSTAVLSTNGRSITPPAQVRAVPIGIGIGIGIGNTGVYPSFANAGQQTGFGLSNVFRLGSFQNSLLFSPSPVAVRRPAVAEPLKV
jgi:hypothetical protein